MKQKRIELIHELIDAEQELEYIQWVKIPDLIKKIKELKPTKQEMKEFELQGIFDSY